jgi:prolipoprotein diacylglyceryltransferase
MIDGMMGAGIIAIFAMVLFFIILPILATVFWVWMIIDCAQRKFKNKNDKTVWILIIIFTNVLGAAIYYFIVKKK